MLILQCYKCGQSTSTKHGTSCEACGRNYEDTIGVASERKCQRENGNNHRRQAKLPKLWTTYRLSGWKIYL